MIKKLFIICICIICYCEQGYCLRPTASNVAKKSPIFALLDIRTFSVGANQVQTDIKPAPYIVPDISDFEWKAALTELGGPIVDISMEAVMPELGTESLEGSKGGLGILEGDSGEGYAESILLAQISGARSFIAMPMYEYRIVPETDMQNKRQRLLRVKVRYEDIIDFEHPVDYSIFADPSRFAYPEVERNKQRPVKIVNDKDGKQLKFDILMYDFISGTYKNFRAAVFVASRGGTPAFMISCMNVDDILYTDNEAGRFSQQALMGKVVPELLKTLGIKPAILRVNEAHTVIAMAEMMRDTYFADTAYIFTNHTPITAGLQIYYGRGDWFSKLSLPSYLRNVFVDEQGNLNFSRAAMILAHIVNGVSDAHRRTLIDMFPGFKDKIRGILNGTGEFWKSDELTEIEGQVSELTPIQLFDVHNKNKARFINLIEIKTGIKLNPSMPIASAIRRIDYYKQQLPMLKPIIKALCQDRGIKTVIHIDGQDIQVEGLGMQVVVGGIIVNEDNNDLQAWIAEFISWMQDPAFKGRFVFISGNDVDLMKTAANGTDCWIEMPRRNPETNHQEEACGTSGMRAAISGNVPIMSSGMWGDEWVRQYDLLTGQGNGFILGQITPLELYEALSIVSSLYYRYMDKNDNAWVEFRKSVYEDAKALYIKNMIKRYVLEVFLPAIRAKKAQDRVRETARLLPLNADAGNMLLGSSLLVSAEVALDDPATVESMKAQVWTDMSRKGSWHAVDMHYESVGNRNGKTIFIFSASIPLESAGKFSYKVRFVISDNGRFIYLPEGFGNDQSVVVTDPAELAAPQSRAFSRDQSLNHEISTAA